MTTLNVHRQHAVPRPGVSSQALSSGAFRQRNSSLSALQQRQSSSCSRFLLSSLATAQPIYKTTLKQHGQSRVSVQAATVEQVTAAPPEQEAADGAPPFSWTSRWWPALALDDLDPKRPTHVDLLGKSLVVFGDTKGNWHCLEDRCPHRLAPLSEGRMEGDNLMCSYHGWQFNSQGKCTSIPQIDDPKAHATACNSPRSCAASYPTKKHAGLLWIWPESSPEAKLTSASAEHQPPDLPHVESPTRSAWYIREVPIRYDMLLENVMDPSHVPFTHHGIQGNRNKIINGAYHLVGEMSPAGYSMARHNVDANGKETPPIGHINFLSPYRALYNFGPMMVEFWAVPTKPGHSKIMASFPLGVSAARLQAMGVPAPLRLLIGITSKLKKAVPAIDHLERNAVIDGDTYMLHVAERDLYGPQMKGRWQQEYYMPANADTGVVAWRQWFQRFGQQEPTSQLPAPPLLPREQVLDRFNQHTKHCVHCTSALTAIDRTLVAAAALCFVAVCTAVSNAIVIACGNAGVAGVTAVSMSAAVPEMAKAAFQPWVVGPLLLALTMVALYVGLQKVRARFIYTDYVHALRD